MGRQGGARVSAMLEAVPEQQTLSLVKVGRARRAVAPGTGRKRSGFSLDSATSLLSDLGEAISTV